MFSGFLGRGKKPDGPPDALDSRGLEVVEDDPDTTWGLWESAVAEQDSKFSALPSLDTNPDAASAYQNTLPMSLSEGDMATQPLSLQERSLDQRREDALLTVELHHHRIANTIRTLWGYKECSDYISKLILSGGDGMGHARIGFNQEAANAMMLLAELHDAQFGPPQPSGGSGFADLTVRTGYDGLR